MLLPHRYLSQVRVRIRWAWLKTKELHTLNRLQIISRLHWLKCSCLSQCVGPPRSVSGGWLGGLWLLSFPGRPWFTSATTFSLEATPAALSSQTAGCWQLGGTFLWGKLGRTPKGKFPRSLKFTWESPRWLKPCPPERSLWRRWARMHTGHLGLC